MITCPQELRDSERDGSCTIEELMKIAIGADHGGFSLKEKLVHIIRQEGCEVYDLGAHQYDSHDDYPDFALAVGRSVAKGEVQRGIVICGSGVGGSVAANKIRGVRAAVCHDTYSAHQGVEHDDLNVLCLGGRIVGIELATEIVTSYLRSEFSGKERYQRRLSKIIEVE